ncbi:MAG TPA: serine/threonine-protein kinase [Leptolyngbyaceae cyanobacterium]
MTWCLNPDCQNPQNPDGISFCRSCGTKLAPLLRNRYRIMQRLGAGGFGRTFLAEDVDKLNEKCVIKQFAPKVQGSAALQKATELFQQEARRLQQLGEHPQIPTLYAYFEEDKCLYLVQQFIEGENLLQELDKQGAFKERKVRELLLYLLPVLKFIHQQNVIHRDIKPENIIRRRSDEKLVLIDFGVAKQLTATAINNPGTHIGTLGYAAIEQMQSGEAYPASDLYSLAVTCFQLLTETNPHFLFINSGYEWVQNWQQHLKQPISDELKKVIDKLLQKDAENRYQSSTEVLNYLTCQQPTKSVPTSNRITLSPWKKLLNLSGYALLLGLGGFLIGLGGYGIWYATNNREKQSISLADAQFSLAHHLIGHTASIYALAISPDSQTLVSGSNDKSIKIWDLNSGKLVNTLRGHKNAVNSVAISPDGQTLASGGGDRTLKLWDLKTGKLKKDLLGHSASVFAIAFSPDNQTLASGSSDNTIKIWNFQNTALITTLTGHSKWVRCLDISPDGETLVSGSEDKTIKIWDLKTGQLKNTLTGHIDAVRSLDISPDGKTLVSGGSDNRINIWDLETGQLKFSLTGHFRHVLSVAVSPDGESFVSGGNDNKINIWDLKTGRLKDSIKQYEGAVWSVAISSDLANLVGGSEDKTIKVWRINR